jgi:predicted nucleic acid-binding protein
VRELAAAVYDAGVLIAADKNERATWAEHRVRLSAGFIPLVAATVVAQVSRSPRQAQMRRFLRGCEVVVFDEHAAHRAGALLARAGTTDVVDASVVDLALARRAEILTTDPEDIERLVRRNGRGLSVSRR